MISLLSAGGINGLFDYIFSDWLIALFIFFAVLILLAVLFKGLKVGIILLIIAAAIAGVIVLAGFIMIFITWDTLSIIDLSIKWGPTILFVTIITISTLVNAKRGLRKSLILLAQAVGACVVCIIFYYVCINEEWVDKALLAGFNGNTHAKLQNMLGVDPSLTTLREVLAEWLPKAVGGDFQILLAQNPQYIVTLADMGFRVVFSVVTVVLYLLLVFLLYVIYFFAYPERRYKKKVNLAVTKNTADRTYTKNHIGGGAVGLVRGITVGLLSLSFIGSVFFIAAGGKGNGVSGDYDLGSDENNYYYSIYRSIESYGAQGIFKVLNTMSDSTDTPFYLFAADMVLSGNLDDEENGIDGENIKFREELAAYTGFARDSLNLLLKYGEDDIVPILNGNGGDNAFDTIVNVMAKPEFRTEFDALIDEFDSKTYIINLGMSLVTAVVDNIDDISFAEGLGEDNRELIKILFKKNYLSEGIPDEKELKDQMDYGIVPTKEELNRPRIKVSHLLNKKDIQLILRVALSFLSGEENTDDALSMVERLIPEIQQLSILGTSRASELDPVLARVYCYMENKYLTAEDETGITYKEVSGKNIKWLNEINTLINVAPDALALYSNVYAEDAEPLDMLLSVFDENNPDYEENVRCYDSLTSALVNSDILGTVLSTNFIYKSLQNALAAISPNIYLPRDINYNRTASSDGEMYNIFGGFKLLTSPENRELLNKFMEMGDSEEEVDMTDLLAPLADALTMTDSEGYTLAHYFTESEILRSVLSVVMIERGQDTLYVPSASLDTGENGVPVNMINKPELKQLLENLSELVNFVKPLLEGDSDSEHIASIAEYLQQEKFSKLVEENRIYEGTVAHLLSIFIESNEFMVVPKHLFDSVDGWVTVDGRAGELRNLLSAIKTAEINLVEIAEGEVDAQAFFDKLVSFDRYKAETFISSQILHYTLSKYLINGADYGGFSLIVPYGAREDTAEDDVIEYTVKKSELLNLFDTVAYLELSADTDISSILSKIVADKSVIDNSKIITASLVNTLAASEQINSVLSIPANYKQAGAKEVVVDFNSSNVWKAELPRLIDALDEILGISANDGAFEFNSEAIKDNLSDLLTRLNAPSFVNPDLTKLKLCYLSDIARNEITSRLDETLLSGGIVPEEVIKSAKSQGYYKQTELQSLSDALDIFNIDLLTTDSAEIVAAVTDMALRLNDPLEDYAGRSALEVIYPSQIISYIFGSEIDKALEGSINESVLTYIKSGRNFYPQQDIADFIYAVKEIGVEDFSSLQAFDFSEIGDLESPSAQFPEESRLNVIYSSRVIAGVISKSVYDVLNADAAEEVDHSKAYQAGVKIYNKSEIESIYNVCGDIKNISITSVDMAMVAHYLYDENGVTSSYLMASLVSSLFKNNNRFIVPTDVLDEEGCIYPRESSLTIEVFNELSAGMDLNEIDSWEVNTIPDSSIRRKMFASELMRARITYQLAETATEQDKFLYCSTENITKAQDVRGIDRLVLSEKEFTALSEALIALSGDPANTSLEVPTFSLEQVLSYDEETLNILLNSDITHKKISDCLLESEVGANLSYAGISPETVQVYELRSGSSMPKPVIAKQDIVDFCEYCKEYLS